ncbi:hypothetical protein F352_150 [Campylobacter phage F352]|uniref:Uncharacterized protein n=4 Tax=Fletchervirus CPX TaxID=1110702 RepID=A0A7T3KI02_9CAUD|nr:hypothetical protein F348_152 [Campylobacter phage F348]QPX63454.1 hypothetical protein F352_150 [Campylobacter phage F352]QPX65590.1 hypothetical protein F374_149 [Campylobacter phage F374]QPX65757.1 hypothetical protein F375_150 [Campylobacter phage F375]QXO06019.1 hypothetical protein [Campylobacter phage CJLB-10]
METKLLNILLNIGKKCGIYFKQNPIEDEHNVEILLWTKESPESWDKIIKDIKAELLVSFTRNIKISSWGKNSVNIKMKLDRLYQVNILYNLEEPKLNITILYSKIINESAYDNFL